MDSFLHGMFEQAGNEQDEDSKVSYAQLADNAARVLVMIMAERHDCVPEPVVRMALNVDEAEYEKTLKMIVLAGVEQSAFLLAQRIKSEEQSGRSFEDVFAEEIEKLDDEDRAVMESILHATRIIHLNREGKGKEDSRNAGDDAGDWLRT